MKNLWVLTIASLLMTGCINNNQSEKEETTEKEITSKKELKNPVRVESPADVNLREGQEFLEANAKEEGVVVLESGVQYKVLIQGTGAIPTPANNVTVHYHGTLLDGTVFDSSVDRNSPFTHNMTDGLIKGWVEALYQMKTGSKYRVFIPFSSAYGEYGSPPKIGPNATLIFEIELLSINS